MARPSWFRISIALVLFAASFAVLAACVTKSPEATAKTAKQPTAVASVPSAVPTSKPAEHPEPVAISVAPIKAAAKNPSNMVGWVENVIVEISDTKMKAKLDTGAETSSLRADIIKTFKKDKEKRVLFSIENEDGEKKIYESKLLRWVRIKTKDGKFSRRPVINLDVCLAGKRITGEVNLSERTNMRYPVLIGRHMLQNNFILNPGKTFLTKPVCKAPAA